MKEKNAAITKEEAEIVFKIPKNNILKITKDMKVKLVVFMIKNYFLHYDKIEIQAIGSSIGMACSATQLLSEEEFLEIEKLQTDLVGEVKFKPSITIIIGRKKR